MKFSQHKEAAKEYNIGSSNFWRPQDGVNRIKVLSEFESYGSHWSKKFGKSITCIGKEKGCFPCSVGDKPKAVFLMWILDRKDGHIKLAQVGYSIIKQIGEYSESEDWKFEGVPEYDLVIKATGQKLKREYLVQPTNSRIALTEAQKVEFMETAKPLRDVIEKMKEKVRNPREESLPASDVGLNQPAVQDDISIDDVAPDEPSDEINIEDIPF